MTRKFDDFKRDLDELCRRHGVALQTDLNGDIQVYCASGWEAGIRLEELADYTTPDATLALPK